MSVSGKNQKSNGEVVETLQVPKKYNDVIQEERM